MTKKREIKIISRWKINAGVRMIHSKAIAENGQLITEHWSSDFRWVEHDMGLTSDWKHHKYAEFYPDGFTLKWVTDEKKAIENGAILYVVTNTDYGDHMCAVDSMEKATNIIRKTLIEGEGLETGEVDEMMEDGGYDDWYTIKPVTLQIK